MMQIYFEILILILLNSMTFLEYSITGIFAETIGGKRNDLIEWGSSFIPAWQLRFQSNNMRYNCSWKDLPACCAVLEEITREKHPIQLETCQLKREYSPSPYELEHLKMAYIIANSSSIRRYRHKYLLNFVSSVEQVNKSKLWLERVKLRMSGDIVPVTKTDHEYLSRFIVTKICGGEVKESWEEFIEPLSIHTRHPYSVMYGPKRQVEVFGVDNYAHVERVDVINKDYLLLHSGKSLHRAYSNTLNRNGLPPRNFIFDAGTSLFPTSLMWLYCIYNRVVFT